MDEKNLKDPKEVVDYLIEKYIDRVVHGKNPKDMYNPQDERVASDMGDWFDIEEDKKLGDIN